MQMFLSKLRVPEGFSAAGLMDINKELGITVSLLSFIHLQSVYKMFPPPASKPTYR